MSASSRDRRASAREAPITFMLAGDELGDQDLSRLESGLAVDPGDLEAALVSQAENYYRAALRAARLEAQHVAAEADARAAEARVVVFLRQQDATVPDVVLLARAQQHADVAAAAQRAAGAQRLLLCARALESAYEQRLRVLQILPRIRG